MALPFRGMPLQSALHPRRIRLVPVFSNIFQSCAKRCWLEVLGSHRSQESQTPTAAIRCPGIVMVKKRNGEIEIREISWTEDAFKYVDLVHINNAKVFESTRSSDNGEGTPGSACSSAQD